MTETEQRTRDSNENILEQFFEAGVTPDFAKNPEEAQALEGSPFIFLH